MISPDPHSFPSAYGPCYPVVCLFAFGAASILEANSKPVIDTAYVRDETETDTASSHTHIHR